MQATITYLLTEQGQRAAIAKLGLPVPRKQVHSIPITADDLPYLKCDSEGILSADLGYDYCPGRECREAHVFQTIDGTEAWAQYRRHREDLLAAEGAKRLALEAECDDAIRRYLAGDTSIEAYGQINSGVGFRGISYWVSQEHPRYTEVRTKFTAELQAQAAAKRVAEHESGEALYASLMATPEARYYYPDSPKEYSYSAVFPQMPQGVMSFSLPKDHPRLAEWIAELDRRKAASDAASQARETAKISAIESWIAACPDEMIRHQHRDGLLSRKTVVAMMAAQALDGAGLSPEIDEPEVCADSDCPCKDKTVEAIPPAVYTRWKGLGVKDAKVEFRAVRNCLRDEDGRFDSDDSDGAGPLEYHAIVTIQSGPFAFTRRIKV